jgi:hypothetical protein
LYSVRRAKTPAVVALTEEMNFRFSLDGQFPRSEQIEQGKPG